MTEGRITIEVQKDMNESELLEGLLNEAHQFSIDHAVLGLFFYGVAKRWDVDKFLYYAKELGCARLGVGEEPEQ